MADEMLNQENKDAKNGSSGIKNSVGYDSKTDYSALINQAVSGGDYNAAAGYEQQRNAKIRGEGLNYATTNQYASYLPGGANYNQQILSGITPGDRNSYYNAYSQIISNQQNTNDYSDYLRNIYGANAEAQKAAVDAQYVGISSNLDAEKAKAAQASEANQTKAAVESQKAAQAWNETANAYGLSSGTNGQAALARNNQLQSDITTIRATQQAAEAEIERQRTIYANKYAADLRQAIASNDANLARALYEEAVRQDEALNSISQQNTANALNYIQTMMSDKNLSAYGYGSTDGANGDDGGDNNDDDTVINDGGKTVYNPGSIYSTYSNLVRDYDKAVANGDKAAADLAMEQMNGIVDNYWDYMSPSEQQWIIDRFK